VSSTKLRRLWHDAAAAVATANAADAITWRRWCAMQRNVKAWFDPLFSLNPSGRSGQVQRKYLTTRLGVRPDQPDRSVGSRLQSIWRAPVHYPSDIRLVNPHAKGHVAT
jgi:hypothetical protein